MQKTWAVPLLGFDAPETELSRREERIERYSKKFGDLLSYVQAQVEQEMQEDAKRKTFERAAKRNEACSDVQIAYVPSEEAKN